MLYSLQAAATFFLKIDTDHFPKYPSKDDQSDLSHKKEITIL